jgi:hypothetical protein
VGGEKNLDAPCLSNYALRYMKNPSKFITLLSVTFAPLLVQARQADALVDYYSVSSPDIECVEGCDDQSTRNDSVDSTDDGSDRPSSGVDEGSSGDFSRFLSKKTLLSGGSDFLPSMSEVEMMVKVGKEVWKVVEANRPVSEYKTDTMSVLPENAPTHWTAYSNWKTPVARSYRVTYKNLYGMKVVDFAYRVMATPGGQYQGKGKYLTQVTVLPESLNVAWGFNVDSVASIPQVTNMGSEKDPVAGAQIDVSWRVRTVLQDRRESRSYLVNGKGEFQALGARR